MDAKKRNAMSGRFPQVSFRIRRRIERTPAETVARFAEPFLCDISDKVGRMYSMDPSIKPFYQGAPRLLGSALTVKCAPGDNMGVKKALAMVEPGDVLVVDALGFTEWCLGGFNMLVLAIQERGMKGLIVNGAYRDVAQAREANFPLYAKAAAPYSGPKRGPFEINVPVCCGGVIVHPGDVVVADEEGGVVVPADYAVAVADALEKLGKPGEEHARDMGDDELVRREADRDEYFEEVFNERNGIYLD
jgi:regulator of RNase E activity RraA